MVVDLTDRGISNFNNVLMGETSSKFGLENSNNNALVISNLKDMRFNTFINCVASTVKRGGIFLYQRFVVYRRTNW